jgi:hypothetical protein
MLPRDCCIYRDGEWGVYGGRILQPTHWRYRESKKEVERRHRELTEELKRFTERVKAYETSIASLMLVLRRKEDLKDTSRAYVAAFDKHLDRQLSLRLDGLNIEGGGIAHNQNLLSPNEVKRVTRLVPLPLVAKAKEASGSAERADFEKSTFGRGEGLWQEFVAGQDKFHPNGSLDGKATD